MVGQSVSKSNNLPKIKNVGDGVRVKMAEPANMAALGGPMWEGGGGVAHVCGSGVCARESR